LRTRPYGSDCPLCDVCFASVIPAAVHHSITELGAVSSYHHFTEDMLQYFCVGVPTALLIKVNGGAVPWIVLTVAASHAYFIHSSMNVNIGPLRYLIGDNHFHRIHHSRDPRHIGRNFGTLTPIWDVLFGTAYFPRKGEWPAVGLEDVAEPARIRDYLLMPAYDEKTAAPGRPAPPGRGGPALSSPGCGQRCRRRRLT